MDSPSFKGFHAQLDCEFTCIKKSGSAKITACFVKWLTMTVYGYFGTMAETASKYTRDFSKFPIITQAADLKHWRNWRQDKSSP